MQADRPYAEAGEDPEAEVQIVSENVINLRPDEFVDASFLLRAVEVHRDPAPVEFRDGGCQVSDAFAAFPDLDKVRACLNGVLHVRP